MASTRNRTIVGLDIEPSHLAAAEAIVNGRVAVQRAAVASLAPGLVRDGEVVDVEGLSAALKDFFAAHNLGRRVRLGVANQRIVVRTIELPPIADPRELDAAVRFQAQDNIPMPLDEAVLDYQPLGLVETPQGDRLRVVLVAARRDMIDRLVSAARGAGLRPEGIDLSAFAMIRALSPGATPATDADGAAAGGTLYVNVGGMTNLAIAAGSACSFTRVAMIGLDTMVAELAERRGLTLEHAEQWLVHVGLEAPADTIEGDPEIVADARSVLTSGADRIVDEVRNSLDFYAGQGASVMVQRAVITGSAVSIPGFVAQLATGVSIPVESGKVAEAQPGALHGLDPARVTVAAGLSVSEGPA
ncbi:MAG TPA: type IV pilus assembly protein PilM [Solirubrobacteraceae bacterium]|nr:type IV pilus assembly protein PilM [Solirubrobacteraceae bacterium]